MRSKWDILERRHWGGWNWLTCSQREGNIKQTPQPTLVVADSPKKGTINTERLKLFWEPRWSACPSLLVSWRGSNSHVLLLCVLGERICIWVRLSVWIRVGPRWILFKANRFYKWWTMNNNRLRKHTASPGHPGNNQQILGQRSENFFANKKAKWHW